MPNYVFKCKCGEVKERYMKFEDYDKGREKVFCHCGIKMERRFHAGDCPKFIGFERIAFDPTSCMDPEKERLWTLKNLENEGKLKAVNDYQDLL